MLGKRKFRNSCLLLLENDTINFVLYDLNLENCVKVFNDLLGDWCEWEGRKEFSKNSFYLPVLSGFWENSFRILK